MSDNNADSQRTWRPIRLFVGGTLGVGLTFLALYLATMAQEAIDLGGQHALQAADLAQLPLSSTDANLVTPGDGFPTPSKGDLPNQVVAAQTLSAAYMSVASMDQVYMVLATSGAVGAFTISYAGRGKHPKPHPRNKTPE